MNPLLLEQAEANRHINREWWKALGHLSLEELDRPQGAFFGSIFATWNHILLADRIWLGRMTGKPFAFNKLSDRLCHTREHFLSEREHTDEDLIAYVRDEINFAKDIVYRNSSGAEFRTPLYQVLAHVFAHQNHHRGQISQMCHERKIAIPDGGLIGFYRR